MKSLNYLLPLHCLAQIIDCISGCYIYSFINSCHPHKHINYIHYVMAYILLQASDGFQMYGQRTMPADGSERGWRNR